MQLLSGNIQWSRGADADPFEALAARLPRHMAIAGVATSRRACATCA